MSNDNKSLFMESLIDSNYRVIVKRFLDEIDDGFN